VVKKRMSWALLVSTLLAGCMGHGGEAEQRSKMVSRQVAGRGVRDSRVLRAMGEVPRHEFVPPEERRWAYRDRPLPIGHGQTISQPYIVAVMSELAQLKPGDRVLEVGTGSGYQAAVLAALGAEVYSIELLPELAAQAAETLDRLGYRNIQLRQGDGFAGWPSAAPFDAIIVTAAPPEVPPRLLEQLANGGRLVIPVGDATQQLEVHTRDEKAIRVESIFPVRFVPMRGAVKDSVPGTTEPPRAR
jgi:protein-L-isoaspartate(D-aspartate) O-methyltransferase